MKTNYPTQFILFVFGSIAIQNVVSAQTLTCQSNCPSAGQMFSIRTCSPVLNSVGTNQVWNFSQVQAISPATELISYVDPATAPSGTLFPQATVARLQNSNYTFLNSDNNGVRLAVASNSNSSMEPMHLPLPFSYGDTFSQTFTSSVVSGSDTFINSEVRTFTAVGAGTLILPSGTFTNVVSIKGKYTQSSTKNGLPYGYIYYNDVNFYYSDKISHPLLYMSQRSETGQNDYGPYTEFIDSYVTGIRDQPLQKFEISIYPNPTNSNAIIEVPANSNTKIKLTNNIGTTIQELTVSDQKLDIDLSEYPEGVYFVLFSSETGNVTKKLVRLE